MGNGPSRRNVLAGAAALAGLTLTACAPERLFHLNAGEPIELPPFEMPELPTAAPAPPVVDVEAVIAAHEGRVPSVWGMDIPGVVRTGTDAGHEAPMSVFLTLDACGGPAGSAFDQVLIDGLRAARIPATLFLNMRWIEANADVAATLAAEPLFSIQNHGSAHLPLSVTGAEAYGIFGTTSVREAAQEVWANHQAITDLTGHAPRWFRPGTAHLDDVGLSIAAALGERIAGFAINGDGGATLPAFDVATAVSAAVGGELIIAHMNQPESGTAEGILNAVNAMRTRGLDFAIL